MSKKEGTVAIYSRKSKFTGKGESIGNQVELCKGYVRNFFGEDDVDRCVVFEDEGFSGGNLNRPAFRRMMQGVRKHQFRAIVVYRLDRISRNISDFTNLIDELTRLDVSFVSIREQFDTGTPMGRAMMFIISVFSQLERETIAERIRDNMHELAKTGRWLGGNVPTGFRSEAVSKVTVDGKTRKSSRLVPIPEEAEIPKMIFGLYVETDSLTAVETELLHRRIKTRQGKDFTRFAIKGILQNPVYMVADQDAYDYFTQQQADVCVSREAFDGSCGIMAYNRTDQEKGRTTVMLPICEWIIALGQHSGLVPSKQWILVQESLERNKSRAYGRPRKNDALLTGLIFCACGARMYPKLTRRITAAGEPVYRYVCKMKERSKRQRCSRNNADGNLLDVSIMEQIKTLRAHDEHFIVQLEKGRPFYIGNRDQQESRLANLRAEHAQNEKTIKGLIDSLGMVGDSLARPQVLKRIEELTQTNREVERQVEDLEVLNTTSRLSGEKFTQLRQRLSMLCLIVEEMSLEEKRTAVRTLVRKVIWDGVHAYVVLFGADDEEKMTDITPLLADTEEPLEPFGDVDYEEDLEDEAESESASMTPWREDSK